MTYRAPHDDCPYDYGSLIAAADAELRSLEGRTLQGFLVQVVEPEFNVAYLLLEDRTVAIYGRIGGEVLGIEPAEVRPVAGRTGDNSTVVPFPPFEPFTNRRIVAARTIGSAWNGHGFEFSFDGIYDRTMIVQSIYAGPQPPELSDCLRLGVGHYTSTWPTGAATGNGR